MSAAWACTPTARIDVRQTGIVQPGATLAVDVNSFNPGPVVIRWDSVSGPELGRVEWPTATWTTVRIPAVAPDVYYLYATQSGSPNPAISIEVGPASTPGADPVPGEESP
ncbi:MAG: hypothetical protein ACRD0C_24720, partial [Acidimicrobiia bacterium]